MQRLLLLLCAVGSVYLVPLQDVVPPGSEENCGYESCHATPAGMLNVHIVPHTHDDVGWLKTVDQYYYGSRNNIQKAGVQYILDSVIKELWEDPKRRFIYVETAFFWKWWVRQSASIQQKVHTLVREGRLQMVGGAWSMNDEAAAHYQSTVDQFTWGHRKLNQTFGNCGRPRVGWQIDPFGHAREFASLLAMMGFDGLFLGRIDYQDKRARFTNKNMEMVWRGDDVLGKSSDIFTGVLHNTYSPPPGFCFDVLCSDEPIIDDPSSPLYNVESKINTFLEICANISKVYRSNNILITMGEDFHYQEAAMWFKNLDKLIEYTNLKAAKDGLNVTLFYSTPNCYLKSIKDANPTLPTKHDDFFPYASDSTAYWTGYFTSRPTTKFFEREGNNYLQVVKQLQVLSDLEKHNQFVLDELKSAMGVMQHHDAITGTEKQHVTHDYERLLNQALDDALIIAKQAFNKMTVKDATKPPLFDFQRCHLNESRCYVSENSGKFVITIYNPLGWSVKEPIRIPVSDGAFEVYGSDGKQIKTQMVPLPEKVQSIPTRFSKATQEILFIIDLKPLSYKNLYVKKTSHRPRRNSKKDYDFYANNNNNYWDPLKEPIINRLDDGIKETNDILNKVQGIPYAPVFSEDISNEDRETNLDILKDGKNDDEVLELEKFLTENRKKKDKKVDRMMLYPTLSLDELRMLSDDPRTIEKFDDELVLGNQFYKLDVNIATGSINQVTFPDHTNLNLSINMYYYTGSCGDNHDTTHRASGAYIFRPVTNTPVKLTTVKSDVINGDLVKEFRANLSPAGFINVRLYDSLNFIETEWVVGPIPITDDTGKEYVIKYESNIINNGEFYTDSNGRQMLKRKLDFRPQWNLTLAEPIPGNYYPVTNEIYIENEDLRLTVLTDRSEGGTSLVEGEVELMLHRRLLCDDAFGVGEALNETANGHGLVARGKHRVIIGKDKNIKKNVLGMHLSPTVLFSDATNIKYEDWLKLNNEFSWLDKDLPNGVHLLTLEPWDSKLLIRFENYLEDENGVVEVNLKNLFKNIEIKCIKETMLSANMFVDEYEQWKWKKEGDQDSVDEKTELDEKDFNIKIKSKQIRTFLACFERK